MFAISLPSPCLFLLHWLSQIPGAGTVACTVMAVRTVLYTRSTLETALADTEERLCLATEATERRCERTGSNKSSVEGFKSPVRPRRGLDVPTENTGRCVLRVT